MPLLVRKIEKAKWLQNDILAGAEVSADAITNCMKTSRNKLSTWRVSSESDVKDAVLAMVAAHQHLDAFDVAFFDEQVLSQAGVQFTQTPGVTPVSSLVSNHVDIENLGYDTLGSVKTCIVDCFQKRKVKRFTCGELKKILCDAISAGLLSKADLEPNVAKKLSC